MYSELSRSVCLTSVEGDQKERSATWRDMT